MIRNLAINCIENTLINCHLNQINENTTNNSIKEDGKIIDSENSKTGLKFKIAREFISIIDLLYNIKSVEDIVQYLSLDYKCKKDRTLSSTNSSQVTVEKNDVIQEMFIEFPFLPAKLSLCKIIPIFYKYTNNILQAEYLFNMSKRLIFENNLSIKKSAVRNISNIYNCFSDYLLKTLEETKHFKLNLHKCLLESCEEIFKEVIQTTVISLTNNI